VCGANYTVSGLTRRGDAFVASRSCVDFAERALVASKCSFHREKKFGGLKSARLADCGSGFWGLGGEPGNFLGSVHASLFALLVHGLRIPTL